MNWAEALLDAGMARVPRFIDTALCADVLREVRASTSWKPAPVQSGKDFIVDRTRRRSREVEVSEGLAASIRTKLDAVVPLFAARFRRPLRGVQLLEFHVYSPGDFLVYHRDTMGGENEPEYARDRKLSLVLFVNDQLERAPEPGQEGYEGGTLQFYGHDLVPSARYADTALSVRGQAGLLVAFDPAVRHQVQRITAGERVIIATGMT